MQAKKYADVFYALYAISYVLSMVTVDEIRALMRAMDLTQAELAEKVDVKQATVNRWLTRGSIPEPQTQDLLAALLAQAGIRRNNGNLVSSFDPDDEKGMSSNGIRFRVAADSTPEFDLRAGASYGGGYALPTSVADDGGRTYSADVVKAEWKFPPSWLRDEMRLAIDSTDVVKIDGPSMVPDLNDGDRVLIDRKHRDPRQGGIFAVREGDGIIVKHVELVRSENGEPRIRCISSNKTYQPFELVLDGDSVDIIGRVAARICRM